MGRPVGQRVVEVTRRDDATAASAAAPSSPIGERPRLDMAAIREKLEGQSGPDYWQALDEVAETPEFQAFVEREFPSQHPGLDDVGRRDFLKLMGAGMALAGLSACTKQPVEKIVPYVKSPEQIVPGKPLFFATNLSLDGYATGILGESHMGRPTKIEGNPDHPASLGGTDAFAQAEILNLYDPERSRGVRFRGRPSTWDQYLAALQEALDQQTAVRGAGVRVLTGTVTSPSTADILHRFLDAYPEARWHQFDPVDRDNARAGARLAFGDPVHPVYDFTRADVVVSLDADFTAQGPGRVRYARDFMSRRPGVEGTDELPANRLYVLEPVPSPTGTVADHRIPASSPDIQRIARALAVAVGARDDAVDTQGFDGWVKAMADDLKAHRGTGLVIAGDRQPPEVHALAHAVNHALSNADRTVRYLEPVEDRPEDQRAGLRELVQDMAEGKVSLLIMAGGNPVYNTPGGLRFAEYLDRVDTRVHLSSHFDETSRLCHWHIPHAHALESWGDERAYDGTVTTRQPLIEPLYSGKSVAEFLHPLTGEGVKDGQAILKSYWEQAGIGDAFTPAWRRALHDGLIPGTAAAPKNVRLQRIDLPPLEERGGPQLLFRPDPAVYDGRYANNGWLQETPRPMTKLTWDNVVQVSPALAAERDLSNEDVVELTLQGRTVRGPVWVTPGLAPDTVVVTLGYGRKHGGQVALDVGFDTYAIQPADQPWEGGAVEIASTGERYPLACTQLHHAMERTRAPHMRKRYLVRHTSAADFKKHPGFAQHPPGEHIPGEEETLYKSPFDYSKGEQWGMVINLNACTGCSACMVACQAENNIPIVGKEQVRYGREMHWIRVDQYFEGSADDPAIHSQPVNCMHCENAPCEPVCPVGATVHSHDGLNQMVYNRCVGTRYCSNNCPYKVRRFNFFQYTDEKTPQKKLMRNPDVTVRVRGVMEKCTYCVQRISAARIEAKKENRRVRDGEVKTACQQACPTRAIVFGDINDPDSAVTRRRASLLNYGLLADLGTRPRTTYFAKITNPNPRAPGHADASAGGRHGGGDHA